MREQLAPSSVRVLAHHNLKAVFARGGFRRLLTARLVSQFGDGVFQAGLAGSVFFNPERAADPFAMASAFAVLLLPYSFIGPFVGVVLDRWSRRQVLFAANVTRAALVIPASLFVWQGAEHAGFVLLALAIIALNRFFLAGVSASLPHVADAPRLVTANSVTTTTGSMVYALGLGVAAGSFHYLGTGYHPYAVIAVTAVAWYSLSALLTLANFRIYDLGPDDTERRPGSVAAALVDTVRGMVHGVRHLLRRPVAASIVLALGAGRALYGVLLIMTLLLYRNYYYPDNPGGSVAGLLPISAAAALGSLVAALITPPASRRIGARAWVTGLFAAAAIGIPALSLPYTAMLMIAGAVLVSVVAIGVKIVADTALQVECDDEYRGRVFSVNDTVFNLLFVAGVYAGAVLLPADGRSPIAVALVGVAYAVLAGWYMWLAPGHARATRV